MVNLRLNYKPVSRICKKIFLKLLPLFVSLFFSANIFAAEVDPETAKANRQKFINYSKQFIGCPYVLGAIGPDRFDCSGLIFTCSRESIGFQLPRTVRAIFGFVKPISDADREAGDLVFFKTTGTGEVSHAGIYIGNSQFIHAVSDGPNTGVIISSLKENYWKMHYFKSGRFLPSGKKQSSSETASALSPAASANASGNSSGNSASESNSASSAYNSKYDSSSYTPKLYNMAKTSEKKFAKNLCFEGSFFFNWNFFTAHNCTFVFHGLDLKASVRYSAIWPQPFVSIDFNWEYATNCFQIPFEFGVAFNPYFRFYMGPVFTIGNPQATAVKFSSKSNSDIENIKSSIFPGIIGFELQSPEINCKKFTIAFVQDFRYIFYTNTDGGSLNFVECAGNGFVFSTGIRFMLPAKDVLHLK